jgi:hypothetical protein
MSRVESFRRYAAQCLVLSKKATSPADRELLVSMAQHWLELADRTQEFHWPDRPERQAEDQRRQ